MTTADLTCQGQTATPRRITRPALLAFALCLASLPAWAQTAPTASSDAVAAAAAPAAEITAAAKPKAEAPVRSRTDAAASATLAALLPHLAANDTIPLMDRSAMVAGDLSRLLANYDASNGTIVAVDPAENGKVQSLLRRAMTLLGTPYRWGGTSPDSGFDCSGLVGYVFRTALGIELPRVSREMARDGEALLINDRNALAAGDLVFFGRKGRVDHVGIYVGEGRFLHAPSTGKDVRVDSLITGYWGGKFMQARRVEL